MGLLRHFSTDTGFLAIVGGMAESASWYHGTKHEFAPGDLVGHPYRHVWATNDLAEAHESAYFKREPGPVRVYEVKPTGPNLYGDSGDGQYKSDKPMQVIREVPYRREGASVVEHFAASCSALDHFDAAAEPQTWYHDSNSEMEPGTLVDPERESADSLAERADELEDSSARYTYLHNNPRVSFGRHRYEVEPVGPVHPDPFKDEWTGQYRSAHPLRVIRKVEAADPGILRHFEAAARPSRGQETCSCCNGKGEHADESSCDRCDSSGYTARGDREPNCPGQGQPKRRHWREGSAQEKPFYHATNRIYRPGDRLHHNSEGHAYVTPSLEDAHIWASDWAPDGVGHVHEVHPRGELEDDPNWEGAFRTRDPVEVGRELTPGERGMQHEAALTPGESQLEVTDYEGTTGRSDHITRTERGMMPTSSIAHLPGAQGERPGEHANRQGEDWELFKRSISQDGITNPLFITVDHGQGPKISEGNHRRDAAVELGHSHVPVEVRYFAHAEQQGTVHERAQHMHREAAVGEDMIDLYHHTTTERRAEILASGRMHSPETVSGEPAAFFTTDPDPVSSQGAARGGAVVHLRIPEHLATLEDEFPSGEQHYSVPVRHLRPEHFADPKPGRREAVSAPVVAHFEYPLAPGHLGEQGYQVRDESRGFYAERQNWSGHQPQQTWGVLRLHHPDGTDVAHLDYSQVGKDSDPHHEVHVEDLQAGAGHSGKGYASALMDHLYATHPEPTQVTHSLRTDEGGGWWDRYVSSRPHIAERERRQHETEDEGHEVVAHFEVAAAGLPGEEFEPADEDHPRHRLTLHQPGGTHWLHWHPETGEVTHLHVEDRGKGIATAMWRRAHEIAAGHDLPAPAHSAYRSPAGDAWARSVGGHLPPLNDAAKSEKWEEPEQQARPRTAVLEHFAGPPAAPEYTPKPERDWGKILEMPEGEERSALGNRWREEDHDWKAHIRRGLSLGHLTPDRAQELGWHPSGHDVESGSGRPAWRPLPQQMYHVTTDAPGVREHGLKSRTELAQGQGKGLGGGEDDTISLTTDRELAGHILDSMHEFHHVLNDPESPRKMWEAAQRGEGAGRPFHAELARQHENDWKEGDQLPQQMRHAIEGRISYSGMAHHTREEMAAKHGPGWEPSDEGWSAPKGQVHSRWTRPATEGEQRQQRAGLYKYFSAWREHAGGRPDPLFFDTDVHSFARMDPSKFGLLHVRPKPGAQGYPLHGMGEWRTTTGDALEAHHLEEGHPAGHTAVLEHFAEAEPAVPSFVHRYETYGPDGAYAQKERTVEGPFYHGGRARLAPGGLLTPGRKTNSWGDEGPKSTHIHFSTEMDASADYARKTRGHLYEVEPTGEVVQGYQGTEFKSRHPLRVVRKVPREEWDGERTAVVKHFAEPALTIDEKAADVALPATVASWCPETPEETRELAESMPGVLRSVADGLSALGRRVEETPASDEMLDVIYRMAATCRGAAAEAEDTIARARASAPEGAWELSQVAAPKA